MKDGEKEMERKDEEGGRRGGGEEGGRRERTCSRYTGLCKMPRDSRVSRSRFSLVDSPRARSGISLTYLGVKSACMYVDTI